MRRERQTQPGKRRRNVWAGAGAGLLVIASVAMGSCRSHAPRLSPTPSVIVEQARSAEVTLTNDTGRAVNGLRVQAQQSTAVIRMTLSRNAPHCTLPPEQTPTEGGPTVTFRWSTACVQPTDSVGLNLLQTFTVTPPQLGTVTWLLDDQPIATPSARARSSFW